MFEIALFIVVGIFAGILAGLLGVGGGSIIVPTLFFVFSWLNFPDATNIQMAIATSLACIVITSISSTISHNKKDGVRWDVFIVLSIGIPMGAFIGVNFIYLVSDLLLKLIIAVFIIYVGISSFSNKKSEFIEIKSSAPKNIVVGSIIGLLSIPLGIGGGSFCVPYLRMLGFDIRRAIGTSAACGITISIASTILFLLKDSLDSLNPNLGIIYWPAVFWISMSSVFFTRVGANMSYRINEELLKKIFGVVIILLGILLFIN